MKKTILTAVLAIMMFAAAAHADQEANQTVKQGCNAVGDVAVREIQEKPICSSKSTGKSDAAAMSSIACRNEFIATLSARMSQNNGSLSSVTKNAFASTSAGWDHVLTAWYFGTLPTLSDEDVNITYFLLSGHKLFLYLRGNFAESGLGISTPLWIYNNLFADKPKYPFEPYMKEFYAAFFSGDAQRMRTLIDKQKNPGSPWLGVKAISYGTVCPKFQ